MAKGAAVTNETACATVYFGELVQRLWSETAARVFPSEMFHPRAARIRECVQITEHPVSLSVHA